MPYTEPGITSALGRFRNRRRRPNGFGLMQSVGFGAFDYNVQRTNQLRLLFKPWQTWEEVFPGRNVCPLCGTKMTGPIRPGAVRPTGA